MPCGAKTAKFLALCQQHSLAVGYVFDPAPRDADSFGPPDLRNWQSIETAPRMLIYCRRAAVGQDTVPGV
jgi:hypothetical protein